jgi:hypothetical protein
VEKAVRNLYAPGSQSTESRGRLAASLAAERDPANQATGCPRDRVGSTSGVPQITDEFEVGRIGPTAEVHGLAGSERERRISSSAATSTSFTAKFNRSPPSRHDFLSMLPNNRQPTRYGEKLNPRAPRLYDQRHGIDVLGAGRTFSQPGSSTFVAGPVKRQVRPEGA